MSGVGGAAKVVGKGVKLAAKYGPQAKLAWDNGGRQAAESGVRRARGLTARRKAAAQAATVVDGTILRIAPGGRPAYVVFSGDDPIAVHPPQDEPLSTLLDHVDLSRRERPGEPGEGRLRGLPRRG